jgi:hypothetical protein
MSSPVTDRESAEKIWSTCQGANDDNFFQGIKAKAIAWVTSELAAARREGEIAEHKKICNVCTRAGHHGPFGDCLRIKQLDGGEWCCLESNEYEGAGHNPNCKGVKP